MKKLLSIILAIAMLATFVPATFAAEEVQLNDSGVKVTYDLHSVLYDNFWEIRDSMKVIDYELTNGFFAFKSNNGTNGHYEANTSKYFSIDESKDGTKTDYIGLADWAKVSFEIYVPKAGKYNFKMYNVVSNNENLKDKHTFVYLNKDGISTAEADLIGKYTCYDETKAVVSKVAEPNVFAVEIPEAGSYTITFTTDSAGYFYNSVSTFELDGGAKGNVIIGGKITELSDALVVGGDTATVTVEGYLSATTGKATFTYASNNTDVATVDAATGVVTPVGAGTATITATCADAIINNVLTTEVTVEKAQIGEELDSTVQVYIDALGSGSVNKSTNEKIDDVEVGTLVEVEAIADSGFAFSHWQDSEGKYVSDSPKYSFRPYVNTSVIAVFDKTTVADGDTKTVYFYNGNGEYMTKETTTGSSIEMPANATLTGYIFDKWTVDGVNAFDGNNIVKAITRVVAKYQENGKTYGSLKINNTDTVVYDTAKTFNDNNATHWTRNGKTVAYGKEYKHYMWDAATIEAGTGTIEEIPVILLDEHSVEEDFYMIEYDLPEGYTKLEAGILFGDDTHKTVDSCYYKAKSANKPETAEHGQFTAKPSTDTTKTWNVVRGYLVYSDGVNNRVIYADITSAQ